MRPETIGNGYFVRADVLCECRKGGICADLRWEGSTSGNLPYATLPELLYYPHYAELCRDTISTVAKTSFQMESRNKMFNGLKFTNKNINSGTLPKARR